LVVLEAPAGAFSADILAKDKDGNQVIGLAMAVHNDLGPGPAHSFIRLIFVDREPSLSIKSPCRIASSAAWAYALASKPS
jgi:hypothetical protein